MQDAQIVYANYVNLHKRTIYPAKISIVKGKIDEIIAFNGVVKGYFLPGFIDAHVHIESSMIVPSRFAHIAVRHGTVGTVSDPHEIANVLGKEGIDFMLSDAKKVPFYCCFGAPSCVPATIFETAGATLDVGQVEQMLNSPDFYYLSEMMNYPGVLAKDPEVMAKIRAAKKIQKPIDGHAPGLKGRKAFEYAQAGISTDHECFTLHEAIDKIDAGMKILIREGSAAQNLEALHPLFESHAEHLMLCSDDKHPDELLLGHINLLVKRLVQYGHDVFDVLKAACLHPILHYGLPIGQGKVGQSADFILVEDLKNFKVLKTYIKGNCVFDGEKTLFELPTFEPINAFKRKNLAVDALKILVPNGQQKAQVAVIKALDQQLITESFTHTLFANEHNELTADIAHDILKIVVLNRYNNTSQPAIGFIHGFGLRNAAIASSVAHDCHNMVCVGTDDQLIYQAINELINNKGGIAYTDWQQTSVLPLPVAGLMSDKNCQEVGLLYQQLDKLAKNAGSKLTAPFMTLSFMALLVIPSLKMSDLGLFDGEKFAFTQLIK